MKKNKLICLISASLLILNACQGVRKEKESTTNYVPKYGSEWANVDTYIRKSWDSYITKASDLPEVFINAFTNAPFIFYWDTYFINKGLLVHDYDYIAKCNVKNLLFVVDKFGYMGNAAITNWGMNRSQPPYLSEMVREYYEYSKDTNFLRFAYPILKKEYLFWTDTSRKAIESHITPISGLYHFSAHPTDGEMIIMYKELAERFDLDTNISDKEKSRISFNYAVEAATGMDFTTRFEARCPDFAAVELNTLIYTYERNFAKIVKTLGLTNEPNWDEIAAARKDFINKYLWNEKRGMFMDYDFVNKRHSKVASVITYQAMWAGLASPEQAKRMVDNMSIFEGEWGMATTEKTNETKYYQWGEKSIWAPMHVIIAQGLDNYGYKTEAKRIASKFLDIIARNYVSPTPAVAKRTNGEVITRAKGRTFEKYTTSGEINDGEYVAAEMMGWTAASYAWCYDYVKK
ncbi:MAG: hypothetical protein EAZ53_06640 [Bacteroidetes bacterium]|nr:MAG: hypothetical protein EAZ53_06640 [Bacteroidota bacterium]